MWYKHQQLNGRGLPPAPHLERLECRCPSPSHVEVQYGKRRYDRRDASNDGSICKHKQLPFPLRRRRVADGWHRRLPPLDPVKSAPRVVETPYACVHQQQDKVLVISNPDAVIDKVTVVVHPPDAPFANAAVVRSGLLVRHAHAARPPLCPLSRPKRYIARVRGACAVEAHNQASVYEVVDACAGSVRSNG
jgi:hypothetical protein